MKNVKKIVVRGCVILLFLAAFEAMARFCYENWKTYLLTSKRERTEMKGTIETLYCGTSLAARAFQPAVLDELLGTTGFNLANNSQPLKGTYYLIRETVEENPVKQIYLAPSISSLKETANAQEYLSAYENLRTARWKARYLLSVHSEELTVSALLYSTRVEEYLDLKTVKANVKNKLQKTTVKRYYGQRGWRASQKQYQGQNAGKQNNYLNYWDGDAKEAQISGESLEYLYKIADFCREENIELYLVLLPVTQDYIDGAGDMDNLDTVCRALAEELDAGYYNFMLYKERQSVFTDDKFGDTKHFNAEGGPLFSEIFAEVLQSGSPQEYFYDTMRLSLIHI